MLVNGRFTLTRTLSPGLRRKTKTRVLNSEIKSDGTKIVCLPVSILPSDIAIQIPRCISYLIPSYLQSKVTAAPFDASRRRGSVSFGAEILPASSYVSALILRNGETLQQAADVNHQ